MYVWLVGSLVEDVDGRRQFTLAELTNDLSRNIAFK